MAPRPRAAPAPSSPTGRAAAPDGLPITAGEPALGPPLSPRLPCGETGGVRGEPRDEVAGGHRLGVVVAFPAVAGPAGGAFTLRPALPVPATVAPGPVASYLARLSPGSRPTMRSALTKIAALLGAGDPDGVDWGRIDYRATSAVRNALVASCAPGTANRMLAALRGVLAEAWRLGLLDTDAYLRAVDLAPAPGGGGLAGRFVGGGELAVLIEACRGDPRPGLGARDAAIVAIGYGTGVRRAEAVALDLADLDRSEASLAVAGKGGRARIVYLADWALEIVEDWLALRGEWEGPLLCALDRHGHVVGTRIGGAAIAKRLTIRAEEAGVEALTPHDLRRTSLSTLFDQGVDLALIKRLAGHVSAATSVRYDRRPDAAARGAQRSLPAPEARHPS